MDRRRFLKLLRNAGASLGVASLVGGCVTSEEDELRSALEEGDANLAVLALLNVLLPSAGPASPGALDAGALEAMQGENFLPVLVHLGVLRDLPPELLDLSKKLDELLHAAIAWDLNWTAWTRNVIRPSSWKFHELSLADQIAIVEEKLEGSGVNPLYEAVRAVCMISFLGAIENDVGFPYIGLPRYVDFDDGLHNAGYADYSYNTIPAVGGLTVWRETDANGDLA